MKGCPENIAIFGHINRADVAAQKVIFDCEIRDKGFYKFGSITITEISETEVKTQFLEGRSNRTLTRPSTRSISMNLTSALLPPPTNQASLSGQCLVPQYRAVNVALPWVNDYSGNIQNKAEHIVDDPCRTARIMNGAQTTDCRGSRIFFISQRRYARPWAMPPTSPSGRKWRNTSISLSATLLLMRGICPNLQMLCRIGRSKNTSRNLNCSSAVSFGISTIGASASRCLHSGNPGREACPVCLGRGREPHRVKVDDDRCEYRGIEESCL